MGITIHYAGRAKSEDSIAAAFEACVAMAERFGWQRHSISAESLREGGLKLLPHPDCEPVHICFSRTRRFSDFCKTQFAGPEVHQQVRELLDLLAIHMSKLIVYDEAEDIENNGEVAPLDEAFAIAQKFIEEGLIEYPGAQMKVRLPNGRIADLIE